MEAPVKLFHIIIFLGMAAVLWLLLNNYLESFINITLK